VDLKDIKAIIDLMRKNSITEFELEKEDFKIRLKRGSNGGGAALAPFDESALVGLPAGQPRSYPCNPAVPAPARHPSERAGHQVADDRHVLPARRPNPPLRGSRTEVNPETVVCIIEAMKVMNEIKAECKG